MLKTIIKAATSFCEHQLGASCVLKENPCTQPLFISDIDLSDNNTKVYVSIGINQSMLQAINMIFLDEPSSPKEELVKMLLEVTNMIVGSAKVLIQDEIGGEYMLSVPRFKEYGTMSCKSDNKISFNTGCGCMVICVKGTNE